MGEAGRTKVSEGLSLGITSGEIIFLGELEMKMKCCKKQGTKSIQRSSSFGVGEVTISRNKKRREGRENKMADKSKMVLWTQKRMGALMFSRTGKRLK